MSEIVWLASYPKSGNTWLRVLLANYLRDASEPADINNIFVGSAASARRHFDEWAGVEAAALDPSVVDRLRPEVYRCLARDADETLFMKVHDRWARVDTGEPMFPPDVTLGVVYIIRNPLDLASSCAHHWGMPLAAAVETLCDSSAAARDVSKATPEQLCQVFGSWSDHVGSWVDDSGLPLHVVRYEDLAADPVGCFGRVVRFVARGSALAGQPRTLAFSCPPGRPLPRQQREPHGDRAMHRRWRRDGSALLADDPGGLARPRRAGRRGRGPWI